jgi:WavE lipopolysaccharide synthesis
MKTACIIQGNIRNGFDIVLNEIQKHFDVVIVSTWEDEKEIINGGDFVTILNPKPQVAGFSHRNYQRYSTARGIEKAKELQCDYVLKWRTDMLPTKIDVGQFIEWANYEIPYGMSSRIVTCAFRNLTVHEDWYSSIPDLFAFGHVETMELLWGDEGFDYTKMMNPPAQMLVDEGEEWLKEKNVGGIWCAETELYTIFKDRLQKKLDIKLSHEVIAKNYLRLFDHKKLGIIWFGDTNKFRPIFQAWQHPWWSESNWMGKKQIKYATKGYKVQNHFSFIRGKFNWLINLRELHAQFKYYKGFNGEKN